MLNPTLLGPKVFWVGLKMVRLAVLGGVRPIWDIGILVIGADLFQAFFYQTSIKLDQPQSD